MIKIEVYNNGVKINGHADIITCSMVSMTHTILTNNVIQFERVDYYTSEFDEDVTKRNDGYSEVRFNVTDTTNLLLEEYYRQLKELIDYKFFPNSHLVTIHKYENDISLERVHDETKTIQQ